MIRSHLVKVMKIQYHCNIEEIGFARRGHHDWIPKSKITSCNHAAFFVSQIYGLPEWYCVANGLTTPSQRVFTGGRKGLNVVSVAASVSNSVVDDSPANSITR